VDAGFHATRVERLRLLGVNAPERGWDDYSVWGWDPQEGTLFAQLWRNTDDSGDPPQHWITPAYGWPETGSPAELAARIASVTGSALRDALLALAQCAPELVAAELRALAASA